MKGDQLPCPKMMAADDTIPWQKIQVPIYGRDVMILVKTVRCLWYRVSGTRPVRVVITRDPTGRLDDRAYFSWSSSGGSRGHPATGRERSAGV